jgi:hypothetical protein
MARIERQFGPTAFHLLLIVCSERKVRRMAMTRWVHVFLLAAGLLAVAPPESMAQGGGASQTGTINGRVADDSGAVLPGVTVTITSPSMMGAQSTVTNEQGLYRFPAVPPGTYAISYELPGFSTLRREGIAISLGFTATVNVELGVAALQETVTVTGESPVIDTSATRVQQNFQLEELNSIPNARDMWALLAVTPAVQMTRIDVGGNRAGTQTGYTAYGFGGQDQQVRVLVEGINTTEGTGGAGFYFDYGSFEEVFIGTAGQGAEMPHPGVQTQLLGKSGGNNFQGGVYLDWYNNSLQGSNIPGEWTEPTAFNNNPIRPGSNEIGTYRDVNVNLGGPIKQDRLWWYASYRDQFNAVEQVNFLFDGTFDTRLWNLSGKGTYQLGQNHKLIGYYQWGQKIQPNRLWSGSYTYASPDFTRRQDSGSWVYKGEWNGTLSQNMYVEARYGEFGYYFPQLGYTDEPWRHDTQTRVAEGGDFRWQQDRQRRQATGAATLFNDGFLGGSHSFKFGGEVNLEGQWNAVEQIKAQNLEHEFNNGVASRIRIGFPTASGPLGSLGSRGDILSIAKLDHYNVFLSDTFTRGRVTLNLGLRYDHYTSHIPEQLQLASTTAGFSLPAGTFPAQTFFTWDSVVPRAGAVFDLMGDGRTVVKANYGYFKHNPGPGIAASGNPNQNEKDLLYTWDDLNGDRLFQFGEHGTLLRDRTGAGGVQIDPNISQPYTHEFSTFIERQLTETLGVRGGFVYKTNDNLWQTYQPFRGPDTYSVPFNFTDRGEDGALNTSDDRVLQFLGIPRALLTPATATQIVQNVDATGRFKTVELAANKRLRDRWSAGAGFSYTWTEEYEDQYASNRVSPSNFPQSPNDTSFHEFTNWGFRLFGTFEAPYGIRLSPVFRHQSGQPFGRTLTVTAPASCNCGYSTLNTTTILMEPLGTRRMDNVNIFDVRAEKVVSLARTRLRVFADLFNLTNSHAVEIQSWATGTSFLRPTNVIAPRVMRIGFRFEW